MESQQSLATLHRHGAHRVDGGIRYSLWAPEHTAATARIQRGTREWQVELIREEAGVFTAVDLQGRPGDLYRFSLDGGNPLPDPYSRFQPQGVHGPSECIDGAAYSWRCTNWRRPAWTGQSIYEIHIGTFTPEGTFRAAIDRLDHVRQLGVETIEIMPVADFAGERNWGYDGVAIYAPARCYGRPDDLRALVDAAHERGLGVILDVVYNHLGPSGNYLGAYSRHYFHEDRHTPWGQGFNLDGPESGPVRDFFVGNAVYWLDEFRIDGLRLDATHAIVDESEKHLLAQIAEAAHERGAFVIAEDERNSCELLSSGSGDGYGIDAVWSDDFHHQVRVALTKVRDSYFASYAGTADELATTLDHGWFYTGQSYPFWKGRPRGSGCRHLPPSTFVYCIENHDQVGNRAIGERLEHLVSPALFRASSALLCLSPYAPLLFMGQDWAASSPFQYFTDHEGELGRLVSEGRRKEFSEAGLNAHVAPEDIPDPQSLETFLRSKLDWSERDRAPHRQVSHFYRACLSLRNEWLRGAGTSREGWSVAVADPAVLLRYERPGGGLMLVLVSFETGVIRSSTDFPALAPPPSKQWRVALQSEDPEFGGGHGISGSAIGGPEHGPEWLRFEAPGAVVLVTEDISCR